MCEICLQPFLRVYATKVESHLKTMTGDWVLRLSNSATSSEEHDWQRRQRAFFNIRVFNLYAKSQTWNSILKQWVEMKWKKRIGHASFRLLVFSPFGENGREAEKFMTQLAQKTADQKKYSNVIHWVRSKLSFIVTRPAILCIRGSKKSKHNLNNNVKFWIL